MPERLLVSGGHDSVVQLSYSDGRPYGVRYEGHAGEVLAVRIAPDGLQVASAGADGSHVWPIAEPEAGRVVARADGRVWMSSSHRIRQPCSRERMAGPSCVSTCRSR